MIINAKIDYGNAMELLGMFPLTRIEDRFGKEDANLDVQEDQVDDVLEWLEGRGIEAEVV